MLFRQLEYFVSLAAERHFARAAAACYVSQPALSEAIRKLERELGVPLVRRGQNFEGLTTEGEQLVTWARRILADRDAMNLEAAAFRTGVSGDLRLGVIPGAATTVAALVDTFCAAHPRARIRLDAGLRSGEIAERVRRFELDAGLLYPDGVDTAGLVLTTLYRERHVLVGTAGLLDDAPLDDDPAGPTWSGVAGLPLCLLRPGMRGRDLVDEAAAAHGTRLRPRVETDSVATLIALTETGRWASIVPHAWLSALPSPARLRTVALPSALDDAAPLGARVALVRADTEPTSVLTAAFEYEARNAAWTG
ncbi:LysR family transcriptional regulator [Gordonia sp. (in: high G+C Gram-positive bacteria)]|uniref:LysR family transcriptional regulator n=1 Tax=Gordonia sp. (in: high G+C Gram-positive bacteria) TaxID=84139 RepID=UPI00352991B2